MILACGDETSSLPVVSNEPEPPCRTSSEDNCEYGVLVDDRDGQTYKTVKIRNQWWMKENLKFRYVQPTSTLDSCSFCYNDTLEYCGMDGRLYLWSAAMDSAGVYTDNGKGCGNGSDYNGQYDYSRRVYYGNDAVYWSTASKDSLNSVALILRSADHHVSFGAYGYAKFNTAPVRCVKD